MDSARALADGLGRPFETGAVTRDDPATARLAILDAELGETRATEIAPRFDARRHVRFTSAWASARWDLITAYHDALAGRLVGTALTDEADRLAAHAGDPAVATTATWLTARAEALDRVDLTTALARVAAGSRPATASAAARAARWAPLPLRPGRPTVDIASDGAPILGVDEDASRPRDLILGLASGAPDAPVTAPASAAAALVSTLGASLQASPDLRGEVALITGASPGSIAIELTRRLLRGGATRRPRHLDRHAGAAALLSRPVPDRGRPGRGAPCRAREPRVLRGHRRARGLAARARRWAPGPRRPAPRPVHADAARAVRRAAHDRRSVRGRRQLRDGAAPPAPRRPAPHRDPRGARAALRPAPALAQPRRLRRRRAVRRDQGCARSPPAPRELRTLGPQRDAARAAHRLGPRHRVDGRQRRARAARRGAAGRADVRGGRDGLALGRARRARSPRARAARGRRLRRPLASPGPARRARTARRRAARPVGAAGPPPPAGARAHRASRR